MKSTYKWGILGPGNIAHQFAQGLSVTEKGKIHAVGSRDISRAKAFAEQYGAEKFYGSYEELIMDDDLDIIYIATPHHLHYELTKKCFDQGKNVLCEKPICINSRQFEELRLYAKEKNVFYMDAIWTRFHPIIKKSLELVHEIGEIKTIKADFGFKADYDPNSRLFNPELGGGTILDIGIYTLFMPLLFLGKPDTINANAIIGETGVDNSSAMILSYNNGAIASLLSTFMTNTSTEAEISGTKGKIIFHSRFFMTSKLTLALNDKEANEINMDFKMNGYEYEAEEAMKCLDKGLLESPLLPLSFTSDLMSIMDEVRDQIGVKYSCDN